MGTKYDNIIVGSGPSGCAVASGLTRDHPILRVLVLEAGDNYNDKNLRIDGKRWLTHQEKDMNWRYKTVPQEHCGNREIDYSRGCAVGGSSAINFSIYSVGARDDYDEWARILGDDAFKWDNMKVRFKELETYHRGIPAGVDRKYAAPSPRDHGASGPLHVGYAAEWERDLVPMLDIFEQAGFPLNPDHNSGNPIGMSVSINSANKGLRSTAKDLLDPKSKGLTVIFNSPVQRIIIEGKKAVGVEANGIQYRASREVIICAGALDTPRILIHSGIGPKEQLEKFHIPVVKHLPGVGQGLRDHYFVPLANIVAATNNDRRAFYSSDQAMEEALEQWKHDSTGPWSKFACELGICWFKLEGLSKTKEFQDLPAKEREYLQKQTVPHYEIVSHFPLHWFMPEFPHDAFEYSSLVVFLYNAQSRGERVTIEALRDALRIANHSAYIKDKIADLTAPKSGSDADLLEYWKQNMSSSWHMTGTAKMGSPLDEDAVVDRNFCVNRIKSLRVADMSVVPLLVSGHTQAAAYVTGATCAEMLIRDRHFYETYNTHFASWIV
ncbi:hypothetical protein AJ79_02857 [Helicocarpus griseus UAMH5409]|uniref:Glucose-methanol-choline oxidoreductase N-terminal domain-containing protein n=1 Tax=Helicocarpus griseus UAMH5409 TaxID=1447875 RepID=A0A2B7Y0X7_9EURO|nr:hypothetical protein AJ79_02857 [Helicocarpus griseus UAMH5409]